MAYSSTLRLIKPLRIYGEEEIIPFFAHDSASINAGSFVKVKGSGWKNTVAANNYGGGVEVAGDAGASYAGVYSQRMMVSAQVTIAGTGDANKIVGLILKDVRETDENGEQLKFRPRKAAELDCVISGQANPVLTKGVILVYSTGAVAGDLAYISATNGQLDVGTANVGPVPVSVGKYLGDADDDGFALLKLEL